MNSCLENSHIVAAFMCHDMTSWNVGTNIRSSNEGMMPWNQRTIDRAAWVLDGKIEKIDRSSQSTRPGNYPAFLLLSHVHFQQQVADTRNSLLQQLTITTSPGSTCHWNSRVRSQNTRNASYMPHMYGGLMAGQHTWSSSQNNETPSTKIISE